MKVLFRVDAATQIGSGHVMRCLTLADGLRSHGAECRFICRDHPGNLIETIKSRGFQTVVLPLDREFGKIWKVCLSQEVPDYDHWIGGTWDNDAECAAHVLDEFQADWIVVDHYGLDEKWEQTCRAHQVRIMVIDDLADRKHDCDLLLDQTFGRQKSEYEHLVPSRCKLALGSEFALLRPQFSEWRQSSLAKKKSQPPSSLLITMGGSDTENFTGRILTLLQHTQIRGLSEICVVLGPSAAHKDAVAKMSANFDLPVKILHNVENMAKLMAEADVGIGTAGSTSWERCCLGMPAILMVSADNQLTIASNLEKAGAAKVVDIRSEPELPSLLADLFDHPARAAKMSSAAAKICDGNGTERMTRLITGGP